MGRSKAYGLQQLRDTMVVSEGTTRSMKANTSVDTGPEVALRSALWRSGVRGYRKNDRRIFGRPDLYFARARLCVFVHGCFWHGCERCTKNLKPMQNRTFWEAKVARNKARDQEVLEKLTTDNYFVVYWECDVRRSVEDVAADVKRRLPNGPRVGVS